jgi:LuxR family maltose regulon positive regulatory protein
MATSLLTTKFYIPPTRPELVARPRLIDRLNAGLGQNGGFTRKLTLISAPAGFGKTTLLSEWVGHCDQPVAWVSLDEGDNEPVRFLAYFIAALQTIDLSIGETALAVLQSPQPPPFEAILPSLINDIATIPEDFALVLDDYHLIDDQPIHKAMTFFLDHQPPNMHLVIAARSDPFLHLSRLRARGQMTEIRTNDLRFTLQEVATFLNQVMGLGLSGDDVAALESRTEGWIAGLQLAALSMQGQDDTASFIAAFTGDDRFIVDYLVDEVLAQRPKGTQDFLLQTSILDRMTGPLCDAVTGQKNGQAVLEQLEQANLFIVPLDSRRQWYRYHHLFADLLRHRLRATQPEVIPELYLRASAWYEVQGQMEEAIQYALAVKDLERAARLLENATPMLAYN